MGFIGASSAAPTRPRVRSLSLRWTVTTSAAANSSSLGTRVAPASAARSGVEVLAPGDHPHAERPADPRHLRAQPAEAEHAQRAAGQVDADRRLPAAVAQRRGPRRDVPQAGARISAQVSSAVVGSRRPPVPQTMTPCAVRRPPRRSAALRHAGGDQQAQVRQPLEARARGNGVRSRIATTTSAPAQRGRQLVQAGDVLVQHLDLDAGQGVEGRKVTGHPLVVVQNDDLHAVIVRGSTTVVLAGTGGQDGGAR